jgi:hypothetical protein
MFCSLIVVVIGVGYSTHNRNVYYFPAKIRVPLRATQAEARRANAKK